MAEVTVTVESLADSTETVVVRGKTEEQGRGAVQVEIKVEGARVVWRRGKGQFGRGV